MKLGRNDPCPCGSGKKYKKCCGQQPVDPQPAGENQSVQSAPTAPIDLGPLLAQLNSGRHGELEASVRRLIEQQADAGILWKLLGAALFAQGKDALPALETAAQLLPGDPESHTNLGNILRARGRLEDAAARHRQAIALKPDYAEAHNNLGSVLRDLGRPEEAAACYRKALAIKPDFAMAHNNLGIALQGLGRPAEAMASHRRALVMKPNFPDAHGNLGNALRGVGRLEEAVASYRRAIEMQPGYAEALIQLSDTLLELGRLEEAAESYRQVLQLKPELTEAHNNLGHALRELGQIEAAAVSYRRAIELKPEYPELHNNLGNALVDLGQIEDAVQSYRRAIELKPEFAKAHSNLGSAFRELARVDEAESSYQRALAIQPGSAEILTNLGVVQRLQGRAADAEASLHRALELNPAASAAMTSLADLHADRGQFAEAENLYRQAIAVQPNSAQAWAGIAALRKMTGGDEQWITEAQRIAAKPLRPRELVQLRYAIGKYFDDVKDYEQAFANYRRANEITKSYTPPHDRQQLAQTFEFAAQLYDRDWVERSTVRTNTSSRPIFIVGMPRSGTSLAEQILASHPQVFGAGELPYWKTASLRVGTAALQNGSCEAVLRQLADEYLRLLTDLSPHAARVVDKMPGNFAHLGMIHAALPNARIIHMRRNPIDTCLSIYFQNFHIAHSYANDLADLAHYYHQYLRLMEHWRSVLPQEVILEVPYEAVVDDQETWSRKMVDFVGLAWDAACIDFHQTNRNVSTFSKWQVRQKISRASVERWRNYEPFVGPLLELPEAGPGS